MSDRYPEWAIDGADWPNRAASRFVEAGGYCWHVQRMAPDEGTAGAAPVCLLLHGTAAATHSWRDLLPLLALRHDVIAPDLPGHGFTRARPGAAVTIEGMAASVARLLDAMDVVPDVIVGHSAGVAIAVQLLLDRGWQVPLVGFAPALKPFPGLAARLFPTLANLLFVNPFASVIFARMAARPGATADFLRRSTGSRIDALGERCYHRLFSHSGHCDGALRMMSSWRLDQLQPRLARLDAPVLLVRAGADAAIPGSAVADAARAIPGCRLDELPALGHLAHEEDAVRAEAIITAFADEVGQR